MRAFQKLCTTERVPCGRKGREDHIAGGRVIECKNRWSCRYQMDLTEVPERVRQERLQAALIS